MDNVSRKDRRQAIRRKGFIWTNKSAVRPILNPNCPPPPPPNTPPTLPLPPRFYEVCRYIYLIYCLQ